MGTQSNTEPSSAVDLARKASSDAANLLKTELALARDELATDLAKARSSVALFGVATVLGLAALELALGAIVVRERRRPRTLAMIGVGCLAAAFAFGAAALGAAPRVLERTRHRVASDVKTIEEEIS